MYTYIYICIHDYVHNFIYNISFKVQECSLIPSLQHLRFIHVSSQLPDACLTFGEERLAPPLMRSVAEYLAGHFIKCVPTETIEDSPW